MNAQKISHVPNQKTAITEPMFRMTKHYHYNDIFLCIYMQRIPKLYPKTMQPYVHNVMLHTQTISLTDDDSAQKQSPAISACEGEIYFNKYVEVEINLGSTYTTEKFNLMDNLLRTLLLGYPFCERTGAILEPRAGTLFISDLKETIPL